jgi:hypothetical protein
VQRPAALIQAATEEHIPVHRQQRFLTQPGKGSFRCHYRHVSSLKNVNISIFPLSITVSPICNTRLQQVLTAKSCNLHMILSDNLPKMMVVF